MKLFEDWMVEQIGDVIRSYGNREFKVKYIRDAVFKSRTFKRVVKEESHGDQRCEENFYRLVRLCVPYVLNHSKVMLYAVDRAGKPHKLAISMYPALRWDGQLYRKSIDGMEKEVAQRARRNKHNNVEAVQLHDAFLDYAVKQLNPGQRISQPYLMGMFQQFVNEQEPVAA